jgi:hypothetical protein
MKNVLLVTLLALTFWQSRVARADPPTPDSNISFYREITTGPDATCVVFEPFFYGALYCWGRNTYGTVGDGTRSPRSESNPHFIGYDYAEVHTKWSHTCASTNFGYIHCWGKNDKGQLGVGDTTDRLSPTLSGGGARYFQIAVGREHTCAIVGGSTVPFDANGNGAVRCWGENGSGQFGVGNNTSSTVPVTGTQKAVSIAAGYWHTCIIYATTPNEQTGYTAERRLKCTGWNGGGQLGDNTYTDSNQWVSPRNSSGQYYSNLNIRQVSAGAQTTCIVGGVTVTTELRCWGRNLNGQVGISGLSHVPYVPTSPKCMPSGVTYDPNQPASGWATCNGFKNVAVGDSHTVARWEAFRSNVSYGIRSVAMGWAGFDQLGQLGTTGGWTDSINLKQIIEPYGGYTLPNYSRDSIGIAAGYDNTCVLFYDDAYPWTFSVKCYGPMAPGGYPAPGSPFWNTMAEASGYTFQYTGIDDGEYTDR